MSKVCNLRKLCSAVFGMKVNDVFDKANASSFFIGDNK
jgi:hypothetical protein